MMKLELLMASGLSVLGAFSVPLAIAAVCAVMIY
jgi:hypothetical protein